jgi:hypothetical protein
VCMCVLVSSSGDERKKAMPTFSKCSAATGEAERCETVRGRLLFFLNVILFLRRSDDLELYSCYLVNEQRVCRFFSPSEMLGFDHAHSIVCSIKKKKR